MPTKVLPCTCTHAYQDQRYGAGKRLHNYGGTTKTPFWRCTVCQNKRIA